MPATGSTCWCLGVLARGDARPPSTRVQAKPVPQSGAHESNPASSHRYHISERSSPSGPDSARPRIRKCCVRGRLIVRQRPARRNSRCDVHLTTAPRYQAREDREPYAYVWCRYPESACPARIPAWRYALYPWTISCLLVLAWDGPVACALSSVGFPFLVLKVKSSFSPTTMLHKLCPPKQPERPLVPSGTEQTSGTSPYRSINCMMRSPLCVSPCASFLGTVPAQVKLR